MGIRDMLMGVTLRWTNIPSRGGVAVLLGMLHAKETGISSGRSGLWFMCSLVLKYLHFVTTIMQHHLPLLTTNFYV